jgi:hypothetical protein
MWQAQLTETGVRPIVIETDRMPCAWPDLQFRAGGTI